MSRSKHTDPAAVRAERRVRRPYEPRGAGDLSGERQILGLLKRAGLVADHRAQAVAPPPGLPRISTARTQPGFHHPAQAKHLRAFLRFFGPPCFYGLRSIQLAQRPPAEGWLFARLVVPGRILLFEQPDPPWLVPGALPEPEADRLSQAGARLSQSPGGLQTLVEWEPEDLRHFMLFEGLMHEVGHHLLQHYQGKRPAPRARTKDHESFAQLFARSCRKLWEYHA